MFSSKTKAERTAAQAWDNLSSAMAAATETALQAGKQTADLAGGLADKATGLADKATGLADKATGLADKAAQSAQTVGRRSNKLAAKASKKSNKLAARAGKKSNKLGKKAGGTADEAWTRANAAAAALAGRRPGRPWGLIAGVALLGAAIGWAVANSANTALRRQAEEEELELAETAIIVTPAREG
jgi:hypothetical protein